MSESEEALACLEQFSTLFDQLDASLKAGLLSKPLSDSLSQCDTLIEEADTQITIAYIIYDLLWIYLRTRGIDPMEHPVLQELERIKQYYAKLKSAEKQGSREQGSQSQTPAQGQSMKLDKHAAARFIKAAIKSAQATTDPSSQDTPAQPKTFDIDHSTRLSSLAKPNSSAKDDATSSSDDAELLVFDNSNVQADTVQGKASTTSAKKSKKRKAATEDGTGAASSAPGPSEGERKKKKKKKGTKSQAAQTLS